MRERVLFSASGSSPVRVEANAHVSTRRVQVPTRSHTHMRVLRRALACLAAIVSLTGSALASAQSIAKRPSAVTTSAGGLTPAQLSLDAWIVSRYKSAGLLPDSGKGLPSAMARAGAPRVDGARAADRRDTLVAVHFDTAFWRSSLTAGTSVRFADPSGAVTQIAGRITARRAFRAPRKPGARASNPEDWRIGWAYLVAIPSRTASAAPSGFNGWSIVDTPSLARKTVH